ncbi:hypothetical protein BDA99DRAFT_540301 [Phascolomyces articulosus]|uniref:F-box domain-containing protein n=1 Tax=Phascolomyces articulosus TaxID=60185 RepID=A0AAD5K7L1_9FUNG|nr:hypothetical protein BDA99DRAFT_540301 [Phascolomyces articulosus]
MSLLLPPTDIGTLSKLPTEVIDYLLQMLSDRDLVCVGRINSWYRNMVVPILTERITHYIQKDGWRIYVNAVTQFVVREEDQENNSNNDSPSTTSPNTTLMNGSDSNATSTTTLETLPENWNDQEAKLLGEQCSVNKETLALEFDIIPLDEEHGFRGLQITNSSSSSDGGDALSQHKKKSILLPVNPRHAEIDIQLYFAKIGRDDNIHEQQQRRSKDSNNNNNNTEEQQQQQQQPHFRLEQANMMSSINLGIPEVCRQVLEHGDFENRVSFGDIQDVFIHYRVTRPHLTAICVEFDKIQASPEWFICQLRNPYDFDMQRISEHSIW